MLLVKIGGGKTIRWDYIAADIAKLANKEQVVIVHGASATRDEIADKLGIPTKTITSPSGVSSVYTNPDAIDVFLMSYCGLVNKRAVEALLKAGVNAIGLSGIDGRLWVAKKKEHVLVQEDKKVKLVKDNLTGKVEKINVSLIKLLLQNGYTPVICPPAISYGNEIVNTDNDAAVAVMAGSMKAVVIVSLFEAPGLLSNVKDEASLISQVKKDSLDEVLEFAKGRMKKKILGAKKAIELGVRKIYLSDGRVQNPVTNALLGKGTTIQ